MSQWQPMPAPTAHRTRHNSGRRCRLVLGGGRMSSGRHDGPILVVAGDQDTRDALREVLEDEGFSVLLAQDGREALQLLEVQPRPCVIVLDVMIPQLNADAFLSLARRKLSMEEVPVIVVTAGTGPIAGKTTTFRTVRKPLRIAELLTAIHAVC